MAAFSHLNLQPYQTHTIIIEPLERRRSSGYFRFQRRIAYVSKPEVLDPRRAAWPSRLVGDPALEPH